mmetsp:Transcript_2686/g.6020  ORF Transcript_2686/g.6020 Transcript_2686/m.6020 type:complete len:339 (+) Transcript_2686:122-1138(+)
MTLVQRAPRQDPEIHFLCARMTSFVLIWALEGVRHSALVALQVLEAVWQRIDHGRPSGRLAWMTHFRAFQYEIGNNAFLASTDSSMPWSGHPLHFHGALQAAPIENDASPADWPTPPLPQIACVAAAPPPQQHRCLCTWQSAPRPGEFPPGYATWLLCETSLAAVPTSRFVPQRLALSGINVALSFWPPSHGIAGPTRVLLDAWTACTQEPDQVFAVPGTPWRCHVPTSRRQSTAEAVVPAQIQGRQSQPAKQIEGTSKNRQTAVSRLGNFGDADGKSGSTRSPMPEMKCPVGLHHRVDPETPSVQISQHKREAVAVIVPKHRRRGFALPPHAFATPG